MENSTRERDNKDAVFQDGWDPAPPNEYAMCKLGAWDREIPRCVRPGCPDPTVVRGVRAVEEIGGAVVRFFCSDPSQGATLMFSLFWRRNRYPLDKDYLLLCRK